MTALRWFATALFLVLFQRQGQRRRMPLVFPALGPLPTTRRIGRDRRC